MRYKAGRLGPTAQKLHDYLSDCPDSTLEEMAQHVYGSTDTYAITNCRNLIENIKHRNGIGIERRSVYRLSGVPAPIRERARGGPPKGNTGVLSSGAMVEYVNGQWRLVAKEN